MVKYRDGISVVIHLSNNPARHRVTSLMCPTTSPLSQTTTVEKKWNTSKLSTLFAICSSLLSDMSALFLFLLHFQTENNLQGAVIPSKPKSPHFFQKSCTYTLLSI